MRHASAGEIQYKNAGAEHCQSNSRPGQHHESHVGLKRGQGAMKQWETGQKKGGKASQSREWDNKRQSEEHPRMMHRKAYRKDPVDRAQK